MRLLFFGDMAATGFGTVTVDLGRELLNLGHDLRFVSQNETGPLPEPYGSRTFIFTKAMIADVQSAADALVEADKNPQEALLDPELVGQLGMTSLALLTGGITGLLDGTLWDGWKPEAAIILGDFWGVSELVFRAPEAFAKLPTLHYVPVEGVDLPPSWKRLWDIVTPVAMSEFGADQIALVTGIRPPVVYHGIDTDAFRPVGDRKWIVRGERLRTKADCKKLLGVPVNARLVLRTDRLMPRKRYPSLLRAMSPVMAARPDVFLMLHCTPVDEGGHLRDQVSKLPPDVARRVAMTNGAKVERDLLSAMYNAADVYASPSAEGFGLTIAEAMACGTPAVGMDYSSVTEVIGPGGLLAPVNHLIDNEYDHAWAAVDEKVFGEQVARLLDDEPLRLSLGREARKHVVEHMSWTKAAVQFTDALRQPLEMAA